MDKHALGGKGGVKGILWPRLWILAICERGKGGEWRDGAADGSDNSWMIE